MKGHRLEFPPNCSSGAIILLAGLVAAGAGLAQRNAPCLALGIAAIILAGGTWGLLQLAARAIQATRELPESAFEGETVRVRLSLRNDFFLSLFRPAVAETFGPELRAQKTVEFSYRLAPGETSSESYEADCLAPRGVYSVGPAAVCLSDPFGWFQVRRQAIDEARIKVYPRYRAFGDFERSGETPHLYLEETARRGVGESDEFFSVREYRRGDPVRRIHWRLSAHRGYPVIREHAKTTASVVHIFLDLFRHALMGFGRSSSLELAVKIAASVADAALGKGRRVALAAAGRKHLSVPPGRGAEQMRAILDALAEVRADGDLPLDALLEGNLPAISAGDTVLLTVSPYLYRSAEFEISLERMRKQGARVVLVVFDASSFHWLWELPDWEPSSAEYAHRVRNLGAEARLVGCGADLAAVFSPAARQCAREASSA